MSNSDDNPEYKDSTPEDANAPRLRPRFTEIATFMRAPLAESFENLDIAMIGVPCDLGVTNRPGARHGPREIRNQSSLMRSFNQSSLIRVTDALIQHVDAYQSL